MNEYTLKPCPFCNGVAELGSTGECVYVSCRGCAAEGGWAKTPGNAVRQWNMRPEEERLRRAVDAYQRMEQREANGERHEQ